MASKSGWRPMQDLARRSQQCYICGANARRLPQSSRQFSSTAARKQEQDTQQSTAPRWAVTPPQMKSPVTIRYKPRDPQKAWNWRDNPKALDDMYIRFLGAGGDKVLPEEVKWLAVTHKSFDQGRRGFNDRLAFFGKRILQLQTTLHQFHSPRATDTQSHQSDPWGREAFQHPDVAGLRNLNDVDVSEILSKERLSRVAETYGIDKVTRWRPKNPSNLKGSGSEVVYSASLLAILGALSLQKGGEVVNRIIREKVFKALGLHEPEA